jgi:hypothetical protein
MAEHPEAAKPTGVQRDDERVMRAAELDAARAEQKPRIAVCPGQLGEALEGHEADQEAALTHARHRSRESSP